AWIWRLILDSATLSKSIRRRRATPLRASASAVQEPTPPMPMTAIQLARICAAGATPNRRSRPPKRLCVSTSASASCRSGADGDGGLISLQFGEALFGGRCRIALRVGSYQVFQGLAGGLGVLELDLAVGNGKCRIRRAHMLGRLGQDQLEIIDGGLV